MNKDFLRPLLIVAAAAILVGLIALIIPAWENDFFPIRKMPWFSALKPDAAAATDTLQQDIEKLEHATTALSPFLQKMAGLPVLEGKEGLISLRRSRHTQKLRIAYYSDSTIEGDLITAYLRHELQSVYGGKGVGMMPITSIVAGFRQTIRHSFSKNWESISFMTPGKSEVSLGITGFCFVPRPYYYTQSKVEEEVAVDSLGFIDSLRVEEANYKQTKLFVDYDPWVEYKAVDIAGGAGFFESIRLYYSHAGEDSKVYVAYDGGQRRSFWLNAGEDLQTLDLSAGNPIKSIKLEFPKNDPLHVYGVSFDEPRGVYVDNYPIRGFSGMFFSRIHSGILGEFQKRLKYDLLVLQYGENVSNKNTRDYTYYRKAMQRTIEHIQNAMPDTPILLISAHDRSIKDASGYRTSPDIPILVKAQADLANDTNSAFFNLFEAMGGYNSMIGYVNQKPALANTDYTHFTRRGADKVAQMLLDYLAEAD